MYFMAVFCSWDGLLPSPSNSSTLKTDMSWVHEHPAIAAICVWIPGGSSVLNGFD